MMVKAVRIHQIGGPEVLTYEDISVGVPGPGEAHIRNEAIGLNFLDVYESALGRFADSSRTLG